MKVCFLTKKEKTGVQDAINYTKERIASIDVYNCNATASFPVEIIDKQYDIIISYISNWIVPKAALVKTKLWNINFHPGPPEYPGIGCFNFALYDSAKHYGVTAHLMEPAVDTGLIIGVKRYRVKERETVESLSLKTYVHLLGMYKNIIDSVIRNKTLPKIDETWRRAPFKREDLESLSKIDSKMSRQEITKRIRSTYCPGKPPPFIELYEKRFEYNPER
jgi:methionyl-tRNA formyltransferase